ncbi:HupE/UreJ family protein [Marivibrio halodurans]|uniref:HupE/UreJ family protein n=1 Tax=Marivibrio halodurans TaxID=2039722 RepID=A0A8J7V053_9PROT|nr:HupE/UreJ family protein [Marivibrio halodurans]MBP5856411.1 HupE/UreJ family protein [Marivibrio halodurans]
MRTTHLAAATLAAVTLADPALAHTGATATSGFASGFLHPIGGLDHVLAMVSVGLFAGLLGGRARWLVPASFVGMMAVGGVAGMAGLGLPMVELGIALSVVAIGGLVALGKGLPTALAMAIVGFFAIFHGHAHGTEAPLAASGLTYAVGFMLATALLHAAGVGAFTALSTQRRVVRIGGAATAAAGLAIVFGIL